MFVQADLNSAPEVLRSVSVKNFKKNADVLVDSGDVLKRPNIFHISFSGEYNFYFTFMLVKKKMSKGVGFELLALVTVQIPFLPVIRIY